MKNATEFGKKVTKAIAAFSKKFTPGKPPEDESPLDILLLGYLRQNVPLAEAVKAKEAMHKEFVDFNEMRVAPAKDIIELLPAGYPQAREKAEGLTRALNLVYDQKNRLDFEYLEDMGKRDLRAHLRETLLLDSFTEAYLMLYSFGGHAIPVDQVLTDALIADDLVHPEAGEADIRSLLERVISAKDGVETFELLAEYAHQSGGGQRVRKAEKAETAKARKTARKAASTGRSKTGAKKAKAPKKAKAKAKRKA